MFRYQILIEYVGSSFIGWQVQSKGKTIQGLIQKKISYLLNEKITLIGSGRTDTGVHAIEQSAHFDCKKKIIDTVKFLKSINYFLNDKGVSILIIDKSLKQLLGLADNFYILEKGRTVWNGPSSKLTSRIAQQFLGV